MTHPFKHRHHCCDRHPSGIRVPHVPGPSLPLLAHLASHPSTTWVQLLPYYKVAAGTANLETTTKVATQKESGEEL